MVDPVDRKRDTATSFGAHADAYLESQVHRVGDDLDLVAAWCEGADRALDVATGAGHTAGAIQARGVETVVAADAAPGMLDTAVDAFPRLVGVVADAERLPFLDGSFDAVACRIAAHHFPEPETFVAEASRVLRTGGTLALEDNVAPPDAELDDFLNRVERLRDPTHVRSHPAEAWVEWVTDAGFTVEEQFVITRRIEYGPWLDQLEVPPGRRAELAAVFADAPPGADDLFAVTREDGDVTGFSNLKVLLRATR